MTTETLNTRDTQDTRETRDTLNRLNSQKTQDSRKRLIEDFKTVIQDTEELIKATASQTGDKVTAVRARAEENLREARQRLDEMGSDVMARGKAAAKATDDLVHEKPWQSVAFATAVGVMLGMLIGRR